MNDVLRETIQNMEVILVEITDQLKKQNELMEKITKLIVNELGDKIE